jgi:hypothetical protein
VWGGSSRGPISTSDEYHAGILRFLIKVTLSLSLTFTLTHSSPLSLPLTHHQIIMSSKLHVNV